MTRVVSNVFLNSLEAASARYESRAEQRSRMKERFETEGILAADSPTRVEKRLHRLHANYALAEAIAQTPYVSAGGRSLETLSPDCRRPTCSASSGCSGATT